MPDPEAMPEGVEEVGAFLRRWRDPVPDAAAKAQVLHALTAELDQEAWARHASPLQEQPRRDVRARQRRD